MPSYKVPFIFKQNAGLAVKDQYYNHVANIGINYLYSGINTTFELSSDEKRT